MSEVKVCDRCGRDDGTHEWREGDCILRHRNHSTRLIDDAQVCVWCVQRHQTWLREILDLYATLDQVLEPGSIPDDTADHKRPKKPADAPAPIRLEAWALLFDTDRLKTTGRHSDLPDIPSVLTGWAQNACDDRDLTGASLDGTVMTSARLLTEHAEFIASRPWVDEYDAELAWVRQALRQAHGVSEGRQPVGRCPSLDGDGKECGGPLWPDRHGAMAVTCGACQRRFDERFLRLLGGMIEAS
jgi:hypothetical protein